MKSPKNMKPEELVHAGQIGKMLATTAVNCSNSTDEHRQTAAQWWMAQVERLRKHFAQSER